MFDVEDVKEIYSHLGDELSRSIFTQRLLYSLTDDTIYMQNVVKLTEEGKLFIERLNEGKNKAIFGAGIWGKEIARLYKEQFQCFVDNYVHKKKEGDGLPIISLEEYMKSNKEADFVISSRLYCEEIEKQLIKNNILPCHIVNAGRWIDEMSKRQYFDLSFLKQEEAEIFVDGGCFDGKTIEQFIKWCGGKYKKIWAFEPDVENAVRCRETLKDKGYTNAEVIEKGLWNKKETVHFNAISSGGSSVTEDGEVTIETIKMDEIITDRVTFIKLDLEGAEYQALEGSRKLITKNKPKLAVSIYHKKEDIWELPKLILEMNPNYRFYLRHYSVAAAETVLYAI